MEIRIKLQSKDAKNQIEETNIWIDIIEFLQNLDAIPGWASQKELMMSKKGTLRVYFYE